MRDDLAPSQAMVVARGVQFAISVCHDCRRTACNHSRDHGCAQRLLILLVERAGRTAAITV